MFNSLARHSVRVARLPSIAKPVFSSATSSRLSLSLCNASALQPALPQRAFSLSLSAGAFQRRRHPPPPDHTDSVSEAIVSDPQHEVSAGVDAVQTFQELADKNMIDPKIINVITAGMGYNEMTKVQRRTITETVAGGDVLAQAKTGTGKTIAFLLPTIQRILTSPDREQRGRKRAVKALIISPTRELASQIYNDAIKLCAHVDITVQLAVGGTGKGEMLKQLEWKGCDLLIATPGRLDDVLSNNPKAIDMSGLDTLVLDEADTLLDAGHAESLRQIFDMLPPKNQPVRGSESRQTLLFSATMPQKVMKIVQETLKPDYKYLKMVEKGEVATHERVKQHFIKCNGLENHIPVVVELCKRELDARAPDMDPESTKVTPPRPFKAIVFCPTVWTTALTAETLRRLGSSEDRRPYLWPAKIFEMHSQLSQNQRTRAANLFRGAESGIMVTSDVLARGMDFPDVTHVIQVGPPRDGEVYIHRLGRTARGDKDGVGYLIMSDVEYGPAVQDMLRGISFVPDEGKPLQLPELDLSQEQKLPKSQAELLMSLTRTMMERVSSDLKVKAYMSLMGYYAGNYKSQSAKQLMADALNRWPRISWGMEELPRIDARKLNMIGYAGIEGFNVGSDSRGRGDRREQTGGSRGGRGFGGGFGGRDRGEGRNFGGRDRNEGRGFGGRDRDEGRSFRGRDRDEGRSFRGRDRDEGRGFGGRDRERGRGYGGRGDDEEYGGFGGRQSGRRTFTNDRSDDTRRGARLF